MQQVSRQIIRCSACGTPNRVPVEKIDAAARCGKCSAPLQTGEARGHAAGAYTLRCEKCSTKNRVPAAKIEALQDAGIAVAATPDVMGETLLAKMGK